MTDTPHTVAFVTGAASGIGKATAEAFLAQGTRVFACDIDQAGLDALAAAHDHEQLHVHSLDVTDGRACEAAISAAANRFGGIDHLCNIAGVAYTNHFHATEDEAWKRVMDINVNSVFFLCRAAIDELKKSKGCIVNMASIAGLMGQAYTSVYCASKAAVIALTKSLAIEYSQFGIRANAVCPAGVNTPLVAKFSAPDDVDYKLMQRYSPITRMAEAEEVAATVVFLCSKPAAAINGVALPVDDGITAS